MSLFHSTERMKPVIKSHEFAENVDKNLWIIDLDLWNDFLQNFQKLFFTVSLPDTMRAWENPNSEFADSILWVKNVYLSFGVVFDCENVLYSYHIKDNTSDVMNCVMVRDNCSNVFNSYWVIQSYKIFYSRFIYNCADIWFSTNLM